MFAHLYPKAKRPLESMRRSGMTGEVSGPGYQKGSAVWRNDGMTKHSTAGASFIGKDRTAVCHHGACALVLRSEMFVSISLHSSHGTATSANCRMMERACLMTFAPILIIRSRRLVSDQSAIAFGTTRKFGHISTASALPCLADVCAYFRFDNSPIR